MMHNKLYTHTHQQVRAHTYTHMHTRTYTLTYMYVRVLYSHFVESRVSLHLIFFLVTVNLHLTVLP